jgi:hypothetical protein
VLGSPPAGDGASAVSRGEFPHPVGAAEAGIVQDSFFFSSLLGSVGVCVDWSGKDGNFLRSSLD